MKANLTLCLVMAMFLASCQTVTPTPLPTESGQKETQVAATIYANQTLTMAANNANQTATIAADRANQTATAAAKISPFNAARTADALTAAANTPIPTPARYQVTVPASACWMNSKITVHTGQKVTISASGISNTLKGNQASDSGPDGQPGICGDIECPVRGVNYGALVGRLEDGKPFFVGANFEFVATKDGQLYFSINDWKCEDNSGEFKLSIMIN